MFWLAVIGGSLILLHAFLLIILRYRKSSTKGKSYGALILPRFEIFLVMISIPCICLAAAAIIKGPFFQLPLNFHWVDISLGDESGI